MKFSIVLKRNGELADPNQSQHFEVKSFAEATFLLVEDLSITADKDWSVEIIDEWLKKAARALWSGEIGQTNVSVVKTDQEREFTFSYEVV